MNNANSSQSDPLEAKLLEIERLEKEHGIVGVKISVPHGTLVTTGDSADSVLHAIRRGSSLLNDIEAIPLARRE